VSVRTARTTLSKLCRALPCLHQKELTNHRGGDTGVPAVYLADATAHLPRLPSASYLPVVWQCTCGQNKQAAQPLLNLLQPANPGTPGTLQGAPSAGSAAAGVPAAYHEDDVADGPQLPCEDAAHLHHLVHDLPGGQVLPQAHSAKNTQKTQVQRGSRAVVSALHCATLSPSQQHESHRAFTIMVLSGVYSSALRYSLQVTPNSCAAQ